MPTETGNSCPTCRHLAEENARLKKLLTSYGIRWEEIPVEPSPSSPATAPPASSPQLTPPEKIALFRRLFRGREDIYPRRWESAKGASGYSPVCGNEWKPEICHKRKVKCGGCAHRLLLALTDQVLYDHLAGKHTIGVYPLLLDDTCFFLAVDFDEADWREDAKSFIQSCKELKVEAALEISRSGNGAHAWIFFAEAVPARSARQLGLALISYTCNRTRQLSLASYDRLFPNQDTLPKGGFGNLIALPLQKKPREQGRSVFVDEQLVPFADQWAFLATLQPLAAAELEKAIEHAARGAARLTSVLPSTRKNASRGNVWLQAPPWSPARYRNRCRWCWPTRSLSSRSISLSRWRIV